MPTVSVIVPCLNERGHIEEFLLDVRHQRIPPGHDLEVIVADGGSDDGTWEALRTAAKRWPALRVLVNPRRIVSTGLNMAIRAAAGTVIVRMDVHTRYAPDYIARNIAILRKTGADCVGGPWRPRGTNYVAAAIAAVFDSWLVSGGGRAHSPTYEGPVDTVYLGCWKRAAFGRFGFFDETLVRSQDNELNYRIRAAGGAVWQSPRIRSWYEPRSSIRQLFRQYAQYGYWKAQVLRKHGRPVNVRQLAPPGFVALLAVLAAGALLSPNASLVLNAVMASYGLGCVVAALVACRHQKQRRYLPIAPFVIAMHHLGFGYGFLRGLLDLFMLRRSPASSFCSLTRNPGRAEPLGWIPLL